MRKKTTIAPTAYDNRCVLWLLFMSLPSDIQSQLTPRERVIEHRTIVEGAVYATNRCILLRHIDASNVIESIPYPRAHVD